MSVRTTRDHRRIPRLSWEQRDFSDLCVYYYGNDVITMEYYFPGFFERIFTRDSHFLLSVSFDSEEGNYRRISIEQTFRETETQIVAIPTHSTLRDSESVLNSVFVIPKKEFRSLCFEVLGLRPSSKGSLPQFPTLSVEDMQNLWFMTSPYLYFHTNNQYTQAEVVQRHAIADSADGALLKMVERVGKEPICERFRIVPISNTWKTMTLFLEHEAAFSAPQGQRLVEWNAAFDTTPLRLRLSEYWAVEILE